MNLFVSSCGLENFSLVFAKIPVIITEAVYTAEGMFYLHLFCTLLFYDDERIQTVSARTD